MCVEKGDDVGSEGQFIRQKRPVQQEAKVSRWQTMRIKSGRSSERLEGWEETDKESVWICGKRMG